MNVFFVYLSIIYGVFVYSPDYFKKTHRGKGCGWLTSRSGSKSKKRHIVAKDVVGLQVGDSKNNREFD